jgi:predicted ATPase
VLLAYEDMHWSDPTTQELLGLVIERVSRLPVLLLITFRPEFSPPWPSQPHVSTLALSRLGRREGAALVERVVRDKPLPDEVAAQIVAKTDGVPLFVEELTKAVLESGLLKDAGDHWELAGPLAPLALPSTLHDSLLARLDRLAPEKEIAQIGAALGREFSHELLAAVADRPEAELQAALDQLVAAELVYRRGTAPDVTYSFKHALVQDAAYGALLKSRRQQLHAKIGSTLEERFPKTIDTAPELLAQHFTQAGQAERGIAYWQAAAQHASERSAHQEAIAHLRKGIELLRELPETQKRNRLELPFQISLGSASVVIGGFAAAPAEEAYARARELARGLDEQAELFTATWGLWIVNQHRLRVKEGRALANELLAVAEPGADSGRQLQAHHAAWTTLPCVPELAACRHHAERGLALYDPVRHVAHKFQYGGHDPGVCGLTHLGLVEWLLGFPDEAVGHAREAVSLARNLEHGPSLAIALNFNSYVYRFRGEVAAARELSDEQVRLCVEQGIFPQHVAWGRFGGGWALARTGDVEAGLVAMREGLRGIEETNVRRLRAYNMAVFAEACIQAARFDEGRRALTDALDSPECWWEPEVHRLRGTLALAMQASASQEAEQNFHRALTIARAHQSRSLELRAATSLARLWAEQGKRTEAHDLLAPVYGWFTEGFDTADLKDAKALLDELR